MQRFLFLSILILIFLPLYCLGQSNFPAGDKEEYYFRILQISDISDDPASYSLRPYRFSKAVSNPHPWQDVITRNSSSFYSPANFMKIDFFEPLWFQSYNTSLPRGTNDGPLWQGKGYNTAFSIGVKASLGPLHIKFRPMAGVAQNLEYDLGPYNPPMIRGEVGSVPASEFAYRDFLGSIDYVQRYGENSYSWFDLGDSSIELRYSGVKIALSNQRIWSGPSLNTSLQFGYSAPGFRHLYLGTYRPLESAAGSFEFAYIFGQTRESDYFTVNKFVKSHSVNSLIFIYKPWFTRRFSLGFIRTYFFPYPQNFSEFRNQTKRLFEPGLRNALRDDGTPRGFDPDNQVGSIFFRYLIPEYGIEFYTEYGRNDHNADWRDFRAQPNHHRAYTIGILKSISLPEERLMALHLEINQLEAMRTALTRGQRHLGGWYTHGAQILGFTNKGQILGTGYGPGINMQKIRAEVFDEKGSLAFKVARITYHNSRVDQFFQQIQNANSRPVERWEVRNIELLLGAEITAFLKHGIELTAGIDQSYILNHHNLAGNDLWNTRFEVVLRKQMSGWLR